MTAASCSVRFVGPCIELPGRRPLRPSLDLELERGSRQVFLGRSGSGKSLLCQVVLGRIPPSPAAVTGRVEIDRGGRRQEIELEGAAAGSSIPELQALLGSFFGYVPQGGRENLVPGWNLERHIAELTGKDSALIERCHRGMEQLGLPPDRSTLRARATELSEGMIRRALLALSVALPTDLLVVDEPTTGLDPESREAVVRFLQQATGEDGRGLLLTTHDLKVARALGERFFHVVDGALAAQTESLEGEEDSPFGPFLRAERLLEGAAA